jgi:hypothetical protein
LERRKTYNVEWIIFSSWLEMICVSPREDAREVAMLIFQKRRVLSIEPDTITIPSGEKETEQTQSVCPSNGLPMDCPVVAFQRRTVLSFEPDTICFPSGEKATE